MRTQRSAACKRNHKRKYEDEIAGSFAYVTESSLVCRSCYNCVRVRRHGVLKEEVNPKYSDNNNAVVLFGVCSQSQQSRVTGIEHRWRPGSKDPVTTPWPRLGFLPIRECAGHFTPRAYA